jgi:hypothetical protein
MALGEVPGVLPAGPMACAAAPDIPPVVSARPGLGVAVARSEPGPALVLSILRLRSIGPC